MKLELEMVQVEKTALMRESQAEISTLRNTIDELLASKSAVVARSVMTDTSIQSSDLLTHSFATALTM